MTDPPGLDLDRLTTFLREHAPRLVKGPLRATLIAGGKSNLTYRVGDGTSEYVLRRPPLGHVLATAHDMVREHRVISALAPTAVPVPEPLALCADDGVLGAPFYLMSLVPGEVLRHRAQVDGLDADARTALAAAMIDTLAELHTVDPAAVGLADFGRPDGFLARQVRRWAGQLDRSRSRELPGADELRDRLAATVPRPAPPAIVHGDYRLDNILVDIDSARVNAVLDWEMATLGDPLTDLGLLVTYWDVVGAFRGGGPGGGNPVSDAIGPGAGFPTITELLDRYARRSTLDLSHLHWYVALGCYKLAVIAEGIHFRYIQGKTVGAGFDQIGTIVAPLLRHGLATIGQEG